MQTLKEIISEAINLRLLALGGNQSKAAISLGISRGTLRKYMSNDFKLPHVQQLTDSIMQINKLEQVND